MNVKKLIGRRPRKKLNEMIRATNIIKQAKKNVFKSRLSSKTPL